MTENVSRRKFLAGAAVALTGSAAMAGEAAAHNVGLPVYTSTELNGRSGPGTGDDVVATVEQYTGGWIIDGPVDADGHRWWKCRWNGDDNGRFTGWSAQLNDSTAHADICSPSTGYCTSDYDSSESSGKHEAIDIANNKYTNVHAGRGGYHTTHWGSYCGNYSVIDHGGGWETRYCHLNNFVAGNGVDVTTLQHIANLGWTGQATGDHVHFEVNYNGEPSFVAGDVGDEIWAHSGVAWNYALPPL